MDGASRLSSADRPPRRPADWLGRATLGSLPSDAESLGVRGRRARPRMLQSAADLRPNRVTLVTPTVRYLALNLSQGRQRAMGGERNHESVPALDVGRTRDGRARTLTDTRRRREGR
jgi:hypothetical protein